MPRSSVDYATDQITIYRGCIYSCRYCYVWRNKLFSYRVKAGKYDPVEEARKYTRRKNRVIVVSFVSDPYPPFEREKRLTQRVLEALCNTDNKVMVLTKNPLLALELDIKLYHSCGFWLGTTIITLDHYKARYWEPKAPNPWSRITALYLAKKWYGVKTWLSIEPIIPYTTYPEDIVEETLDYIDYYVLGSFNYPKQLGYTAYTLEELKKWYNEHIIKTIEILEKHNKQYHIKKELKKIMGENL